MCNTTHGLEPFAAPAPLSSESYYWEEEAHSYDSGSDVGCDMARHTPKNISFSGIVTFKNASNLKEVAKAIPLDRMLIETDSPYLAPVPYRGKINDPSNVIYVAEEIAKLKNISLEEVGQVTTQNFFKLFSKCRLLN